MRAVVHECRIPFPCPTARQYFLQYSRDVLVAYRFLGREEMIQDNGTDIRLDEYCVVIESERHDCMRCIRSNAPNGFKDGSIFRYLSRIVHNYFVSCMMQEFRAPIVSKSLPQFKYIAE